MKTRKLLTTLLTLLAVLASAVAVAGCGGKATTGSETTTTPGHHGKYETKPGY
jgi:hypothetical protein